MAPQKNNVLSHLDDAKREAKAFRKELHSSLHAQVYEQLNRWVDGQKTRSTRPLKAVVEGRCRRLARLTVPADGQESPQQAQARMRTYLETVNPGPIAKEIQQSSSFDLIYKNYSQVLARFERSKDIGPLARRYHLPEGAVKALCRACNQPLHSALESLGEHAKQMRSHAELLQAISSDKDARAGIGLAATIAGSLLLGPIGAIGARMITGAAMDPTEKVNASVDKVGRSFERFRGTFVSGMKSVDIRMGYILMSLYGGLLFRLEHDLRALGKRLFDVDFDAGTVRLTLSPDALVDYERWANKTIDQLNSLREAEEWALLGDLADKALSLTIGDAQRALVVRADGGLSRAVQFARMRALAINKTAEIAWSEGRVQDARKLYRHLIRNTNVAWERLEETPLYEAIHVAGYRLAIVATSPTYNGGAINADDLAILPMFVAQTLARFGVEQPGVVAAGEAISGRTVQIAMSIVMYANDRSIDLRILDRVPKPLQQNDGLQAWKRLFERDLPSAIAVRDAMDHDAAQVLRDNSDYLKWIASGVTRQQIRFVFRWLAIVLFSGLVMAGGYFAWISFVTYTTASNTTDAVEMRAPSPLPREAKDTQLIWAVGQQIEDTKSGNWVIDEVSPDGQRIQKATWTSANGVPHLVDRDIGNGGEVLDEVQEMGQPRSNMDFERDPSP